METVVQATSVIAKVILRRVISEAKREREKTLCHLNDGATIFLSNSLGAHIRPGDEINFPLPTESAEAGTEIYVRKASSSGGGRDLYHAPISYAAQPKADKRERLYIRAGWAFPASICLAMSFAITSTSPRGDGLGNAKRAYMTFCGSLPPPHLLSCGWP